MKKTKLVALSLVLALILNMIMPLMTVVATSSYTITFTATEGHTIENDNGNLKIDGQYVDLRDSNNNTIGEVNVTDSTSGSITVTDGTIGTLNYNSANAFTLYNTNGHVPYNFGTELSSNTVFMVEDYDNGGNPDDNNPPPSNNNYPDDIQIKGTYKSDGVGMHITFNGVNVGEESKNVEGTAKGYATGSEKNIIKIQLAFGDGNLGSVLINGKEMTLPENVGDFAEFEVEPASEYIIVVTKSEDMSNVPHTIIWTNPDYKPINEENAEWVSDFKIEHGYAKVIAVYDETGKKLSPEEYIGEDSDEFGLDNGFGWVKVFPKYKVVFEFVPEYGYQLTEIKLNDQPMETSEDMNFFTVTIPEGNIHFKAVFTETKDIVISSSEKVSGGSIELGNTLPGGSAQLFVKDVELSSDKISGFENAAGEYSISNYLNIDLYNVYYKGKDDSEDVWLDKISELENEATISIKLEEGVNADDIVIVHNIHDGDEYEIIEIDSYDSETNTITFKTKSFSNYAIASKTVVNDIETEESSANPKTGDNIIMFSIIFVIALTGILATFIINKKEVKNNK